MNDNTNVFNTLSENLATETGIDTESAGKVIKWLISEGVLDMPVVNDNIRDGGTLV